MFEKEIAMIYIETEKKTYKYYNRENINKSISVSQQSCYNNRFL